MVIAAGGVQCSDREAPPPKPGLGAFVLEIEATDFSFEPATAQQPVGTFGNVEIVNAGEVDHTFTIETQDIDIHLTPGEQAVVQVDVEPTGTVFVCTIHEDRGMRGEIRPV